ERRSRYLMDTLPVRLGGLAANFARIKSFSDNPAHSKVVESLLEESKFFIEWLTPEAGLDLQEQLVNIQIQLALWQQNWQKIWNEVPKRTAVTEQIKHWSEWILKESGLTR
ncbi:MAG: hypothetical protein AB1633_10095, partial [Elusimicrobiota bacterium]